MNDFPQMKAVVAMSLNRVIADKNRIPWRIPQDSEWFKSLIKGYTVLVGRLTFLNMRGLKGQKFIVLSSTMEQNGNVPVIRSFADLSGTRFAEPIWVCGGTRVYKEALPFCSDLYLTLVKRKVKGDTFFPAFEGAFYLEKVIEDNEELSIRHYRRQKTTSKS